eukprot:c17138_g1_i1.p1 GENE.c17138_g1_i1~~c17138_g1_i1.p1  ORF type:complete len:616 (-),score=143.08 c17138_g1_i1:16-1863(-)
MSNLNSLLWQACQSGSIDNILILLDKGADINFQNQLSYSRTPLHLACENSNLEVIQVLIENGADLNTVKSSGGWSALIRVANAGLRDVVKKLLENGCDLNIRSSESNGGWTALTRSILNGDLESVKLLTRAGCDLEIRTSESRGEGHTPFTLAAFYGQTEILKELIKVGSNINAKTKSGKNALDWAKEQSKIEIVKLLSQTDIVKKLQEEGKIEKEVRFNQENVLPELTSLQNIYLSFSQLSQSIVQLHNLIEEQSIAIQKLSLAIESFYIYWECEFDQQSTYKQDFEKEVQIIETKMLNQIKNVSEEAEYIKKKLFLLRSIEICKRKIIDAGKKKIKGDYNKKQCDLILKKIDDLMNSAKNTVDKWRLDITKGSIDNWQYEELLCTLEEIGLEKWFEPLKSNQVTPSRILLMNFKDLMNTRLKNGETMKFGDVAYLKMVFQTIIEKKLVHKVFDDPSLNLMFVTYWTVNNVVNYFEKIKLKDTALILKRNRVNGFILLNLNKYDSKDIYVENEKLRSTFLSELSKSLTIFYTLSINNLDFGLIPKEFICPITGNIMDDPVLGSDGFIYERVAIEKWFQQSDKSPMTNKIVHDKSLIPSSDILHSISNWKSKTKQ